MYCGKQSGPNTFGNTHVSGVTLLSVWRNQRSAEWITNFRPASDGAWACYAVLTVERGLKEDANSLLRKPLLKQLL